MGLPIAVQLYTVRDRLKEDFAGTLSQIADIGYDAVEFAGLYGQTAAEARVLLDSLGLDAVAAHVGLDALEADLPQQIDDAKVLGYPTIVIPWIGESHRSAEGYKKLAKRLADLAGPIADAGLTLAYHNHDFEFHPLPGDTNGHEILKSQTDPQQVQFELDLYWIAKAGLDPHDYAASMAGRAPLLHIKDMADTPDRGFAEVGTGIISYARIIDAAADWGAQALVVEQDAGWVEGDPIRSVRISYEHLSGLVK